MMTFILQSLSIFSLLYPSYNPGCIFLASIRYAVGLPRRLHRYHDNALRKSDVHTAARIHFVNFTS